MKTKENTHLSVAKESIRKGDLITATVELTAAINEDAKCSEAYFLRGQLSMAFGDRDGALNDFKTASELDPTLLEQLNGEFKNKEEKPVFKVPGLKKN